MTLKKEHSGWHDRRWYVSPFPAFPLDMEIAYPYKTPDYIMQIKYGAYFGRRERREKGNSA